MISREGKGALMPTKDQRAQMRETPSSKQSSYDTWQRPTFSQGPTFASSANVSPISKPRYDGPATPALRSPGGEELGFRPSRSRVAVPQSSAVLNLPFAFPLKCCPRGDLQAYARVGTKHACTHTMAE